MNLRHFRYLELVVRTGSVRRAAEVARVSPAAVSKALAALQDETGLELLVPSGRGVAVTPTARLLAGRVERIARELDELDQVVEQARNPAGAVRLGSYEIFTTYFAGALVADGSLPGRIDVSRLGPGDLEAGVINGDVDLAITHAPQPVEGVEHRLVCDMRMLAVGRETFRRTPFDALPFAVPARRIADLAEGHSTSDGWPAGAPRRHIAYQVAALESALELCRQGHAVAYVPEFVVRLHNEQVRERYRLQAIALPPSMREPAESVYTVSRVDEQSPELLWKLASAIERIVSCSDRLSSSDSAIPALTQELTV